MTSQAPIPASVSAAEPPPVSETPLVSEQQNLLNKVTSALGTAAAAVGTAAHTLSQKTEQAVQTVANTTTTALSQTGQLVTHAATTMGQATGQGVTHATTSAGQLTEWVQKNTLLSQATETLNLGWLVNVLDAVDKQKVTAEVRRLQRQYPNDSPRQLAQRLMVSKTTLAAGTGLASSALPGIAAALFAVDFAVTMSLQAELVYQIAAVYGLDLKDPARKGEVLAIFGLSMGGNKAIEGGLQYATRAGILGFLKNVPAAGAVIGCSTNAAMTYSLGYGACRFYEGQLQLLPSEPDVAASTTVGDSYLGEAMAQEVIMDLILVHVLLASSAESEASNALLELQQTLGLSPATLQVLQHESLPPLLGLLPQVNADFARPLVIRCQKIAELDGLVTAAEMAILTQISETLMKQTCNV